ncbi:MAG: RDD family protein [Neptuniibacter sp.]
MHKLGTIMQFKFKRALALIIDIFLSLIAGLIFLGLLIFLASLLGGGLNINLTKHSSLIGALAFFIGYVSLNTYFLGKYQASCGKKLMGLKVVGTNNIIVLLLRTLVPVIASYITIWLAVFTCVNYLVGFGSCNKCGHDHLFKTEVVNA